MRAVRIERPGVLKEAELERPQPGPGEALVRVHACGVCRTDLHLLDGEVEIPNPPIVPGHQIVGTVIERGPARGGRERGETATADPAQADPAQADPAQGLVPGARVGIPWLGWTCGVCRYCRSGRENLCERARFTGRDIDGGFAELTVADERFCLPLPEGFSDLALAPLLCAGLIGYRALKMTGGALAGGGHGEQGQRARPGGVQAQRGTGGEAQRLGLYGFGSAAHIIAQVARFQGRRVFAFTRPGDESTQAFALQLGAEWAGDSTAAPPEQLDAAIVFASAGELVAQALRVLARGGTVVCAGIHMSEIPSFPYEILWGERAVCSVANLTRQDAREFLALAPRVPVRTDVQPYPLADVPRALEDLRAGRFEGSAVIDLGHGSSPA
ncbi:MAG TPA: zinc-dependent alcohol dehydrogenase family protein [Solirubrobacteraceae bacterium]|jgi:propanol-preferring alcohol dehydrogenase|nr:zinc-dependent alcohol dehydrogenase family protein [Solirubrobacteraceae bacterium]